MPTKKTWWYMLSPRLKLLDRTLLSDLENSSCQAQYACARLATLSVIDILPDFSLRESARAALPTYPTSFDELSRQFFEESVRWDAEFWRVDERNVARTWLFFDRARASAAVGFALEGNSLGYFEAIYEASVAKNDGQGILNKVRDELRSQM